MLINATIPFDSGGIHITCPITEVVENIEKRLPKGLFSTEYIFKLVMPQLVKFINTTTLDELEIKYLGKLVPNRSLYYLTNEQYQELQNAVADAEQLESQIHESEHVIQQSNN